MLRGLGARAVITFSVVQLVGATITFTLNKLWVFEAAQTGSVGAELSRSVPVLAGAFVLNTALPSVGTGVARIPAVIAYLLAQALVYLLWSFPLNRRWVFRGTSSQRRTSQHARADVQRAGSGAS